MTKYKNEKPYTIHYRSPLQNYTMAFRTLQEAIPHANMLNRPVLDENKKLVYAPAPTQESTKDKQ